MILKVKNITKIFSLEKQTIIALKNVSFEVNKGEFFTIIGPSGCGKSTLLRIIAGLDHQTEGSLEWIELQKFGFVFQNYALFPYLTVFENIGFGLKMENVKRRKRHEIIRELINEIGLNGFEDKHPKELSGGMKQRVGIARSLAIMPSILLLDEPFSQLDEFTAESLRKLLLDIWQKRGITIILITHLIREALELADRIAVMTSSPGRIEQIVNNNLKRPRNLRSPDFFVFEDKLIGLVKP